MEGRSGEKREGERKGKKRKTYLGCERAQVPLPAPLDAELPGEVSGDGRPAPVEDAEPRQDVVVEGPEDELADLGLEDLRVEARGRDDLSRAHEIERPVALGIGSHVDLGKRCLV